MQMVAFRDAWTRTSGNKNRIYTKRAGATDSGFERSVEADFPRLAVNPKFTIAPSDRIFTIGSCFARNIEAELEERQIEVITARHKLPDSLYELSGIGARNGALNAYTPHSMLDTLRLIEREDARTAGVLRMGDEQMDMVTSGLRVMNDDEARQVRAMVLDTYADLPEAGLVIITLGYTETWWDNRDKMFVNRSPAGSVKTVKHADRYSFINVSAPQVIEALNEIVAIIRKRTEGRAKIIFTVSPVPLHGTFTDRDVVSANAYSKATLLSAAVTAVQHHDDVDYFPSYELVTMANPASTWEADGMHVGRPAIAKVMDSFLGSYLQG